MDDTALTTVNQLLAENARLQTAVQMLTQEQTHAQIAVLYAEEEGDPVPSATYVSAALVQLLSEEREARRHLEAQLAATQTELRRLKCARNQEHLTC